MRWGGRAMNCVEARHKTDLLALVLSGRRYTSSILLECDAKSRCLSGGVTVQYPGKMQWERLKKRERERRKGNGIINSGGSARLRKYIERKKWRGVKRSGEGEMRWKKAGVGQEGVKR